MPTESPGDEGPVTQFELLTAAAFVAFAAARVQYAVVEAGLGGRLDATNVIPSQLTVLTSVGYDHTEWLGETLEEIAAEKVAVLRGHTMLLVGEVPDEVIPIVHEGGSGKACEGLLGLIDGGRRFRLSAEELPPRDGGGGTRAR